MPIVFGYTPATNIVVVTGGTAGVPATFADFVTADRAGNYTVMDAIATAMNLTLDRLIRPVEFRALKITFTLAGTNAGAGDTVDITGTDAWGNAQNESINVAAGNGAYVSAKYWRTITDIDCTGFADGVGTIDAVQPQWGSIWDYGNKNYKLDSIFYCGDGFIPTYFGDSKLHLIVSGGLIGAWGNAIFIRNNADFRLGEIDVAVDRTTKNPVYIRYLEAGNPTHFLKADTSGDIYFYGVHLRGERASATQDISAFNNRGLNTYKIIWNCTFDNFTVDSFDGINGEIHNSIFNDESRIKGCSCFMDRLSFFDSSGSSVQVEGNISDATMTNLYVRNNTYLPRLQNMDYDVYCIDWDVDVWNVIIPANSDGHVYRRYTCNVHVVDKDGIDIQNAIVACEDQFGAPVFSVNTDVNGNIVEQIITYKEYYYNAQEDTFSPHEFTISKAGYETLELDAVTVGAPIVWHLELLPALAASDVRDGLSFLEDRTGSLDLPSINDVEDGVFFDSATKEGNFEAPAEEDVEVGVGYGSLGTEFTGTYLGLRGENLTAILEESVALVGQLQKKVDLTGELAP